MSNEVKGWEFPPKHAMFDNSNLETTKFIDLGIKTISYSLQVTGLVLYTLKIKLNRRFMFMTIFLVNCLMSIPNLWEVNFYHGVDYAAYIQ